MKKPYEHEKETMTVKELIDILQTLAPEMPIMSEGCDCYGTVVNVQLVTQSGGSYYLINRDN